MKKTEVTETAETLTETMHTVIYAVLIAMLIRIFLFEPFNIPSSSMVPNLLVGDYLFVSKYSYGYSSRGAFFGLAPMEGRVGGAVPEPGDVIVFKLPSDPGTDYIKRLVGMPGDVIQVREGILHINGDPVARRAIRTEEETTPYGLRRTIIYEETLPNGVRHIMQEEGDNYYLDNTPEFAVPEGHYFFMGDNRDNSQDSRTPTVGFVPAENLVGRAEAIFFSLSGTEPFWQFWDWPNNIRWDRLFIKIK
jgi:signal peptidase I